MKEQPGYYSIIPAKVRYDKSLQFSHMVIYSEITALANQKGYCSASNQYFAELYDKHKVSVSRMISKLKEAGHIHIEIIKGDNNQVVERKIYPLVDALPSPASADVNTPINTNVNTPINTNANTPINTDVKENNTSNNNTLSMRKFGTFNFDIDKGPRGVQLVTHAVKQTKAYIQKYGESHITSHVEKYNLGWSEEETKAEIEEMWRHYSTEKEVALHCVEDYLHKLWPRWCKTASERQKRTGKKPAPAVSLTEYAQGYPDHLKRSHQRYLARSKKYYPALADSKCRLLSPVEFLTFFNNLPSFWPIDQAGEYVDKLQKELNGDKWLRKENCSVYEYLTKQVAQKAQGTKSLTPLLDVLT